MTTNLTSHMGPWTWPFIPLGLTPLVPFSLSSQGVLSSHPTSLNDRARVATPFPSCCVLSPCPPQMLALRAGRSPGEVASPWPFQPPAAPQRSHPALALSFLQPSHVILVMSTFTPISASNMTVTPKSPPPALDFPFRPPEQSMFRLLKLL